MRSVEKTVERAGFRPRVVAVLLGAGASLAWPCAALAQSDDPPSEGRRALNLREVSQHWGSDVNTPLPWILFAGGLLLTALGVWLLIRWWRKRHSRSRPWAVFLEVAQVAGLSVSDRWLLVRIARQQALPTPLTLLLSGRTLRLHAREFAAAQPPWRRAALMQRVASIRRDVFGDMGAADTAETMDRITTQDNQAPAAV